MAAILLATGVCGVEVEAGQQHLGGDVGQNLPGVGVRHLGVEHSDDLGLKYVARTCGGGGDCYHNAMFFTSFVKHL